MRNNRVMSKSTVPGYCPLWYSHYSFYLHKNFIIGYDKKEGLEIGFADGKFLTPLLKNIICKLQYK